MAYKAGGGMAWDGGDDSDGRGRMGSDNLTIDLRMTREKDGLQQICCFIHGLWRRFGLPARGCSP